MDVLLLLLSPKMTTDARAFGASVREARPVPVALTTGPQVSSQWAAAAALPSGPAVGAHLIAQSARKWLRERNRRDAVRRRELRLKKGQLAMNSARVLVAISAGRAGISSLEFETRPSGGRTCLISCQDEPGGRQSEQLEGLKCAIKDHFSAKPASFAI